jgi:hypothetical protein
MHWQEEEENSYRVEISGWDVGENFFVEKTALKWDEQGSKEVCVQSPLREGTVVFVRLLQAFAAENNYPIAYQAFSVGTRDARGLIRVGLQQLRARRSAHERLPVVAEHAEVLPS